MRHVGFLNDSSYASLGDVVSEGLLFGNLADARESLRGFYESNGRFCSVSRPAVDEDALVTGVECVEDVCFPAMTRGARLDLYEVSRSGVVSDGPVRRVVFGPRGGVWVESY